MIVKRNDLRLGIVNGERGVVSALDLDARRLTLDCSGELITLGASYLDDRTVHGDPTFQHGYAMTVHVAQGLTVDRAFVLAGPGLNRELAYTALSRGRHSNRLYAARDPDTAREEYAPSDGQRHDPVAQLRIQLGTSSASTLAIDTGRGEADIGDRLVEAQRELADASEPRRAAEGSCGRWLPRARREIERLRHDETLATRRLAGLRREDLEQRHAARPFVTESELDARLAKTVDRFVERRVQRELDRGRDLGRGLER